MNAFIKEAPKRSPDLSIMSGHSEKEPSMNQEERSHAGTLNLDFPALRTVHRKLLLYVSYPVSGIPLIAARKDDSTSHFSTVTILLKKKDTYKCKDYF